MVQGRIEKAGSLFGIDETEDQDNEQDEAQTAETKNQNAVPASEVPYINDVQTPAVNMLQ